MTEKRDFRNQVLSKFKIVAESDFHPSDSGPLKTNHIYVYDKWKEMGKLIKKEILLWFSFPFL